MNSEEDTQARETGVLEEMQVPILLMDRLRSRA